MVWNDIERLVDSDMIKIPENWLDIHYYEALNILFRFENSLRVFVYIILKSELKEKWDTVNVRGDDSIKKIASIRISQAKDYGYLCYDIKSPMLYLSSGDLIDVIMNDKNWKYFKKFFKAKKEIIKHKLLEIGAVRNSLAHFRPIQYEDLDVIKQNLKHTLSLVEDSLNNITSISNIVPTNTNEEWYKELNQLNNERLKLNLFQDNKTDWIKISVELHGITFKKGYSNDSYKSFTVCKLSTINILNKYNEIKNNITYCDESFMSVIEGDNLNYSKFVNFVFSKNNLRNNFEKIIIDLKNFSNTVDNEIKLVSADNLAMGELISSAYVNCTLNEEHKNWNVQLDNLQDNIDKYDGSEFWGQSLFNLNREYITSLQQFPWMPINISKSNFYF